ncbi:MAG TPA: hypothetical protein PKN71_05140 [Bacillota bacterium]|nr:hypothetical protein [Bacillota bacterium]HPZ22941.1 hypothetical protein [Bacillota bacterium]HQD20510.1 hypothetical protein [Bacillota bacterium]
MNTIDLFAGANSAAGFYCRYQCLAEDSLNRVFILKGGPGTGKSTMIKRVASHFSCPLEKYHCTAAPDSLDALFIPSLLVSVIDGTAPHTIDPSLPGAVQQVIDLGSFWDESILIAQRQKIQDIAAEKTARFKSAYGWLAVAGKLADQVQQLERRGTFPSPQEVAAKISGYIPRTGAGTNRHAFATGITAAGIVNYLPGLKARHSFSLTGGNRAFNSLVLEEIARRLSRDNIPAHYLYCGLQPQYLEHIYIPGEFAVFSSHPPHTIKGNTGEFGLEYTGPSELESQVSKFIQRGIKTMAEAARFHSELEEIYSSSMDYTPIAGLPERIVEAIRHSSPKNPETGSLGST